jgi:Putative metallopeptidase
VCRRMTPKTFLRSMLVAGALVTSAEHPASAQDGISARIKEASRAVALAHAPTGRLDEQQQERVVEFVVGNALFTLGHELGHAVVSEFNLPVLGREEDAVDAFATLALLHVGTDFTHGVLVDSAHGLMLIGERDARMGVAPAFYGEHGLDRQRAYKIVCLMVGSDPATFGDLARRANLPEERQETCKDDFEQAKISWLRLLEPHLRASSQPSFWERLTMPRARHFGTPQSSVAINDGDASGDLAPYRDMLKTIGLLEEIRDFAAQNFVFPQRIAIEARTCGEPNAFWYPEERRIALCYEFLAFHADLALRP